MTAGNSFPTASSVSNRMLILKYYQIPGNKILPTKSSSCVQRCIFISTGQADTQTNLTNSLIRKEKQGGGNLGRGKGQISSHFVGLFLPSLWSFPFLDFFCSCLVAAGLGSKNRRYQAVVGREISQYFVCFGLLVLVLGRWSCGPYSYTQVPYRL